MRKKRIKDDRYPPNWEEIALEVKEKARWRCAECGQACLRPDEKRSSRSEQARLTLTVHHSDYNPANNALQNLIPLCAPCHLSRHIGRKGNISPGQLSLFSRI